MPYHVYLFEPFEDKKSGLARGESFNFMNLGEEELKARVVEAWDRGEPITWSGQTANSLRVDTIKVFYTDNEAPSEDEQSLYEFMRSGQDRTNQWITGPAGARARASSSAAPSQPSPLKDRRRVMVVHGRNLNARNAMFTFLRSLGLSPIEWEDAIAETGMGSPHNLDAVRAAMDIAQAVVVILTAEDQASIIPALAAEGEDTELRGQPRQNVTLEAGMGMGIDRAGTILVELGPIRQASDFDGLNAVRLTNSAAIRGSLRSRLRTAGCDVNERGNDWMGPEAGGDFEGGLVVP